MKKQPIFTFVCIAFSIIILSNFAFAKNLETVSSQVNPQFKKDSLSKESHNRDEVIQREFDCIHKRFNEKQEIVWENICYSLDDSKKSKETKEEMINRALDLQTKQLVKSDEKPVENERQAQTANEQSESAAVQYSGDLKDQQRERESIDAIKSKQKKLREESLSQNTIRIKRKKQETEFGGEVYRFSYKEPIFNLEDKGIMYGVYGSYRVHPDEGDALYSNVVNMYKVEGRFGYGTVDYESNPSGTIDDIRDYTFEIRGMAGNDYYWGEDSLLTPFFGFGVRYLNDDTGGKTSSTGATGYERESRYFYLPIGAEFTHQFTNGWLAGFIGEYDVFITGTQTSHLSDIPGYPDLKNHQGRGYGFRGSLKLIKKGEKVDFLVEPFIRYWHIRDSDTSTATGNLFIVTGLEPNNNTTELGIKLGVQY